MYEERLTPGYAFGSLSAAVGVGDTTVQSAEFGTDLPAGLSTTTYVPITVHDPVSHVYEIMWVIGHAASSSACTVVRGRESSTARAWPTGTAWAATPTVRDGVMSVADRASLPADPHSGMRVSLRDEMVMLSWTPGLGWGTNLGLIYRERAVTPVDYTNWVLNPPANCKVVQAIYHVRAVAAATDTVRFSIQGYGSPTYSTSIHTVTNASTNTTETGQTTSHGGWMNGSGGNAGVYAAGEITVEGWNQPVGRTGINWQSRGYYWENTSTQTHWNNSGVCTNRTGWIGLMWVGGAGGLKAGSEFLAYGYA